MNSIPVHVFQCIVIICYKLPIKNPIFSLIQRKARALSVLTEAKWLVGNGSSIPNNHDFWLKLRSHVPGGNYPNMKRVCDFIDQATA